MTPIQAQEADPYTCPMHPEIRERRPGACPQCGMALVPADDQGAMADHGQMIRDHHRQMLWTAYANMALGAWLVSSVATFDPGRAALVTSDALTGLAIVLCAGLSLSLRWDLARWGVCLAGLWLLFAPLVFWAPSPAAYGQDTLIGTLVIALSVLVPGMPGKAHHMAMMQPGPDRPPGWTYNPSSWLQRGPLIALGFIGLFLSRYLMAYQLGYIEHVWDPFFGAGTRRVLESDVSRAWPISDAGLGAVAYLLEALSGFMGDAKRWRTMPWMVLMFGILTVPLSLVSTILIILQPVAVGAWCTVCLATAVACVLMITPALDEVIAMGQFLGQARREGQPVWRLFWTGGTLKRPPPAVPPTHFRSPAREIVAAMELDKVPWTLLASAALGMWLIAAPAVVATSGVAAGNDHVIGALVVTCAVIAFGEPARAVRFANVLFGAWLLVAPWWLAGETAAAAWNHRLLGLGLVVLSLPRGSVYERYGAWSRWIV